MSGVNGVNSLAFRRAVGRFPTGVTLCTTVTASGTHHGITANSFTSVSLDPVLVLVSIEKVARFHDEVLRSRVFGVSVLGAEHEAVSRRFARRGRPETLDQFDGVPHGFGAETGCILLSEALAVFECRVWSQCDGGDHTLVVGEVLTLATPRPETSPPLLYHEARYRSL